jgi:hypothetical protein
MHESIPWVTPPPPPGIYPDINIFWKTQGMWEISSNSLHVGGRWLMTPKCGSLPPNARDLVGLIGVGNTNVHMRGLWSLDLAPVWKVCIARRRYQPRNFDFWNSTGLPGNFQTFQSGPSLWSCEHRNTSLCNIMTFNSLSKQLMSAWSLSDWLSYHSNGILTLPLIKQPSFTKSRTIRLTLHFRPVSIQIRIIKLPGNGESLTYDLIYF